MKPATATTFLVQDIETLGMTPPAALIELGWHSLTMAAPLDGSRPLFVHGELTGSMLFGIPDGQVMPPDNRAVNHIDPDSLEGLILYDDEHFRTRGLDDVDYCVAHNSEFEEQWLRDRPVPWLCTYKIALRLWPDAPSHSNQALKYYLGIPDHPDHHPPHRALPDTIVTSLILEEILLMARVQGWSLEDLLQITREPRLLPRCPIGKHRGRPWSEVPSDYLQWIVRTGDMEADLRWCAERELTRRRRGD